MKRHEQPELENLSLLWLVVAKTAAVATNLPDGICAGNTGQQIAAAAGMAATDLEQSAVPVTTPCAVCQWRVTEHVTEARMTELCDGLVDTHHRELNTTRVLRQPKR